MCHHSATLTQDTSAGSNTLLCSVCAVVHSKSPMQPSSFALHIGHVVNTPLDPTGSASMLIGCWSGPGSATASGGTSRDSLLTSLAADIDLRLPTTFDIEAVCYKYPVDYNESMNTGT